MKTDIVLMMNVILHKNTNLHILLLIMSLLSSEMMMIQFFQCEEVNSIFETGAKCIYNVVYT